MICSIHRSFRTLTASRYALLAAFAVLMLALSSVSLTSVNAQPAGVVLYRVNAGGPEIAATDGGLNWEANTGGGAGTYNNTGNVSTHNGNPGLVVNSGQYAVPGYVPKASGASVFTTERWDPDTGPNMIWSFPTGNGTYTVRLYMRNGFSGTDQPGERVFGVNVEGAAPITGIDLAGTHGHQTGAMYEFISVVSDGTLNIEFTRNVENPTVNAIEIITTDVEGLLAVNPTSENFGLIEVGQTVSVQVTLDNLGSTDSIVVNAASGAGDVSVNFAGATIAPGGSTSFNIDWTPSAIGTLNQSVQITHDGSNSPLAVSLSGEGFDPSVAPIAFDASGLVGESSSNPTSLEFGPDGRLYVAQKNGFIYAYDIERISNTEYSVTATEQIGIIKGIANYNDDGAANGGENNRQITGLMTAGTASAPVLYVTSSDPRIAVGNDSGLDTNSGIISRLTWNGSSWDMVHLVRGFARSEENHSINGLDLDPATNTLFVMVGGHANKGAPSNNLSGTPEYFTSAALVAVDLDVINSMPVYTDPRNGEQYIYDLPTLNDPTRADITNADAGFPYTDPSHPLHNATIDLGDPFGGNNGLNQAITEPGGPVQIYSPGYRNAYDIVFTESGKLYTSDNGPNGGWGGLPIIRQSDSTEITYSSGSGTSINEAYTAAFDAAVGSGAYCTNEFHEDGSNGHGDQLHYIEGEGYYGGQPAPIRAFPALSGIYVYEEVTDGNWQAQPEDPRLFGDLLVGVSGYFNATLDINDFPNDPRQCYYMTAIEDDFPTLDPNLVPNLLDQVNASTNGIAEYTASNFGGAMQGNILTASFNGQVNRYVLNEAGDQAIEIYSGTGQNDTTPAIFSGFGSQPLDITTQGDGEIFPGTVWAAVYGANTIIVWEPVDFSNCTAEPTNDNVDNDNDGFTDFDETQNGTDPCNGGSQPNDFDQTVEHNGSFQRSNLLDADDDNDGIPDVDDAFAWDADNGLTTDLPVLYGMANGSVQDTFFTLGFTGLMTNGVDTYLDQFNEDNLNAGGANNVFNVVEVSAGDAYQGNNTQENAFQFGVNVDNTTAPFIVSSLVEPPLFGGSAPANFQSIGIQIGPGDQDNYFKVVFGRSNAEAEVMLEDNGTATAETFGSNVIGSIANYNTTTIEFFIEVNPADATAQPRIAIGGGPITDLGSPVALPTSWFDPNDDQGLAVGIIATSYNSNDPFGAFWTDLNVQYAPSETEALVAVHQGSNNINASTFGNSSFQITNNSAGGETITGITIDLSTGIFPEIVYDPAGTAGDLTAKDFTVDGSSDDVGNITDTFSNSFGNGGFLTLELAFDDNNGGFAQGETLAFGVDVDPTSITGLGAPGPGESGSVSGLEFAGATVTVEFSDGSSHTTNLFSDGSNAGAIATAVAGLPEAPSITADGLVSPAITNSPAQTINITGPAAAEISLLRLEGGFFEDGLDLNQQPYEVNSAIALEVLTTTLDANGAGSINVTLTDSNVEAGYNYFIATVNTDTTDVFGPTSNVVVLEYDADYVPTNDAPIVTNPGDQTSFEGATPDLTILAEDNDGPQNLAYSATGLPTGLDMEPTNGHIFGTIAQNAAANSPYNVEVEVSDGANIVPVSFVWTIEASSVLYRVNTGGAEVAATDSGPAWAADQSATSANGTAQTGTPSEYLVLNGVTNDDQTFGANFTGTNNTGVPSALFSTERYNQLVAPNNMQWAFPVANGDYTVNLYFAEVWTGAQNTGIRVFDVEIEGQVVLDNFDQTATYGWNTAGVESFTVSVSDGFIDIDFIKSVQNPNIKAIEIIGGSSSAVTVLNGTLSLQGRDDNSSTITVEMYETGTSTLVDSFTPNVNAAGQFTLSDLNAGTYDIWVKHPQGLAILETVTIADGINTYDFGDMAMGDANDDNVINAQDFSALATAFLTSDGDANWNAAADFNGSGTVDITDFSLLSSNYNTSGAANPAAGQ